jgi:hypothetical protein
VCFTEDGSGIRNDVEIQSLPELDLPVNLADEFLFFGCFFFAIIFSEVFNLIKMMEWGQAGVNF